MFMDHWFVVGLINTAAVAFAATCVRWIWTGLVLPRWRASRSRPMDLDGTRWSIVRDEKVVGVCTLRQRGERLSAKVDFLEGARKFNYFGMIRSDMIRMEWSEDGLSSLNFGSLNLKVSSDSKKLTGYTTFVHRDKGAVVSKYCEFLRTETASLALASSAAESSRGVSEATDA